MIVAAATEAIVYALPHCSQNNYDVVDDVVDDDDDDHDDADVHTDDE